MYFQGNSVIFGLISDIANKEVIIRSSLAALMTGKLEKEVSLKNFTKYVNRVWNALTFRYIEPFCSHHPFSWTFLEEHVLLNIPKLHKTYSGKSISKVMLLFQSMIVGSAKDAKRKKIDSPLEHALYVNTLKLEDIR